MDSPSSVYSQSTNGGSPRSSQLSGFPSPLSAHQEQWEQISRLASRNSYEFARLRAQLDELNNRVDAMDSPLRTQLEHVNARTYELSTQFTTHGNRVNVNRDSAQESVYSAQESVYSQEQSSLQPIYPPPRLSSLPTGVLYVPSAGPPTAGRVQRLARERGMRMLRTSESNVVSQYRLQRQRRPALPPPSLANE